MADDMSDIDALFGGGAPVSPPMPSTQPTSVGNGAASLSTAPPDDMSDVDAAFGQGAPANGPASTQSTPGSLIESPFVGFNKGLASIADLPAKALNFGVNALAGARGEDSFGSDYQPSPALHPFDDRVGEKALGLIGANPEDHAPRNATERILGGLGEGAASVMVPEGLVGAAGSTLAKAAPKTADFLQGAFGSAKSAPTALANASVGALGGAGGQGAVEAADALNVPDAWKPWAGMAGSLAGGGLGAIGSQLPMMARRGAQAASDFGAPMTKTGQEQLAGQALAKAAGGKDAGLNAIEDNPKSLVPGSNPTLAEQMQIPGVSALQHQVETADGVPFQERRAEQNAARVGAISGVQPTGAPEDVANFLRSRLSELDARAEGLVNQRTATAQSAAGDLGGVQTPEFYGSQIQGEVQPQVDAARARATNAVQGMGGTGTPEEYGATLRDAAEGAKTTARKQRNALFNAIDPDNSLHIVGVPVRERADQLAQGIDSLARQPSGEEASILQEVRKLPDIVPFNSLRALDSRITTAMAEERRSAGETPSWGRLVQLKGAVQDAIENGVANQIAYERHAVSTGEMAPENSIDFRLTGTDGLFAGSRTAPRQSSYSYGAPPSPVQTPQSLVGFLRQRGGIKDDGGELSARDLHKQFPGLVNSRGMSLDSAREAAAEAGYLGADTNSAVQHTNVGHFLDALDNHPIYSVHDQDAVMAHGAREKWLDDQKRYSDASAELAAGMKEHGIDNNDPELFHDASKLIADGGYNWDDALERAAFALHEHRNEDLYYAALSNRASQGETTPRGAGAFGDGRGKRASSSSSEADGNARGFGEQAPLQPNFDEAAAQRLAEAKAAHANYNQTFKQGPVGQMLRTNGFAGQYRLIDSGVPNTVFAPGAGGAEKVQAYMRAVGDNAEAGGAIRNYAAMSLRRAAERPDGTLDPQRYVSWANRHQDALRAVPGLRQEFSNVQAATEALDRFHPFTRDLAPSTIPEMFFHSGTSGAEGVANLRNLVGDQRATTILSDYAASRLKQAATRQDGTLDPAKTATWLKQHSDAIRALPGLASRFSNAARATDAINDAAALRKSANDAYQQGAIGKLLKVSDPADVTKTIGGMFGQKNSVGEFQKLATEASKSPDAAQGLRKAVVDHIEDSFVGNTDNLKADQFQTFIRKNEAALATVFRPEELTNMKEIAADLARSKVAFDQARIPGQSPTAPDMLAAAKKAKPAGSLLDKIWKAAMTAGEAGTRAAVGAVGAVTGAHVIGGMRSAGLQRVDDIVKEALLNRTGDGALAKALLMKAPSKPDVGSAVTLRHQLNRLSVFTAANQAAY